MDCPDGEDGMVSLSPQSSVGGSSSTGSSTGATSLGRAGIKCCAGCQTTKTPLWRGGPDGPKSLCNACGIRYRKRRREILGINDKRPQSPAPTSTAATTKKRKRAPKEGRRLLLKQSLLLWLNKSHQLHSRLGEEEQAAVLLMALSCGLLYA